MNSQESEEDDTEYGHIVPSVEHNSKFKKEGFKSISQTVNVMPDGSACKEELKELINKMIGKGWQEIDPYSELIVPNNGKKQIRYVRKDNGKLISGGFLVVTEDDYFVYKSAIGANFSVQKSDIKQMWIKINKPHKDKKLIKFNTPLDSGKYEVIIRDVVVFRSNDKWKHAKFTETIKYKKALDGEKFAVGD